MHEDSAGRTRTVRDAVIVVAIGALLVGGLVLPGITTIRLPAQRMACKNNLKQLALAVHTYHDTYNQCPTGTFGSPSLPPEERISFYVRLLQCFGNTPYPWANEVGSSDEAMVHVESNDKLFGVFRCPGWVARIEPPPHWTAYVGSSGIGRHAATYARDDPRCGFFGYDRKLQFGDIEDGMGNTAIFLESAILNDAWFKGGPSTIRGLDRTEAPYVGEGRQFGGTHFGEHRVVARGPSEGMHVALADGSVRYVRDSVDPAILEALITVRGGEVLPAGW